MPPTQPALIPDTLEQSDNVTYFTALIPPLDGEYVYGYRTANDNRSTSKISVGDVIEVPLGRRATNGFVISVDSEREIDAKRAIESRGKAIRIIPQDITPARGFTEEHLAFYSWIARYYAEPLSKILDLAVPTATPTKAPIGYLLRRNTESPNTHTPTPTPTPTPRSGSVQSRIIDLLEGSEHPVSVEALKASCGASAATVRALVQKGLIEQVALATSDATLAPIDLSIISAPDLNHEQHAAASAIRNLGQAFSTTLLQGITGSGKTEVYLTLILEALKKGLSALIIVPEIALTPQLTERFISRLQLPVAVLHSSLKPKERWRHWSDLVSGRVRVAIGARSAIFAPLANLGIIVVDEEHDSSFKQGEGIRYHARDLALVRAKISSCPVILGSATPSLETYHNARTGKYLHLHLRQRYHDAAQSSFEIIDLNKLKPWQMKSKSISPNLFTGIKNTLENGGQSFILYNRRGFASYLQCSSCEHVLGCPHCSVTLTFHRNSNSLICHQCSFTMVPPAVCLGCGAQEKIEPDADPLFTHRGAGTEKVHEELGQLFPTARIAVLDRDTASSVQDYIEILRRVREREVEILVGTQMIAKGHDLPGVTFVGIVDCDVGLHIPDFRAAERSFQLLTQVAGRAGRRSEKGHVILQTRVPTHPSLVLTAAAKYDAFAEQELALRKEMHYPPFHKLLRIIVSAPERSAALQVGVEIANTANSIRDKLAIQVLGPAPAPIERIRTLWRYHILLRSASISSLQHAMKQLKRVYSTKTDLRVSYDLDPHDML
jgi:primosomal protein N' (replication factor Y)